MPVDILDSRSIFMALRDNWNQLYTRDPESHHFLSWQWLQELYERRTEAVYILAYRSPESEISDLPYRAFLPLRKHVRINHADKRFEVLFRMAGNDWADYTGILCDPELENEAINALSRALASLNWSCLQLDSLRISEHRRQALMKHLENASIHIDARERRDSAGISDLLRSPGVTLPESYEEYLQQFVSANTRQKIRRFERKFKSDPSLAIRRSTAIHQESDLRHFQRLWTIRWAHDKGQNVTALARRYALIVRQGLASQSIQLTVMTKNDKPICLNASYIDKEKQTALFFVGARDQSIRGMPVGLLLHAHMIRRSIEQGLQYYDFLAGDEPYKYSLGGQDQQLHALHLNRTTLEKLQPSDLKEALVELRRFQREAEPPQIMHLYRQLHTECPGDRRVLRHFEKWKMSYGNTQDIGNFFPVNASW